MILDLTQKAGIEARDVPIDTGGEVQTYLADEVHGGDLILTQTQDLEPHLVDNYLERQANLQEGRDFKRGGTYRKIGSIPEIEFLRDKDLAEALLTNNMAALKKWLKKHPEYTTVKPGSF